MRISDWSSDVCSSDLRLQLRAQWLGQALEILAFSQVDVGIGLAQALVDVDVHGWGGDSGLGIRYSESQTRKFRLQCSIKSSTLAHPLPHTHIALPILILSTLHLTPLHNSHPLFHHLLNIT